MSVPIPKLYEVTVEGFGPYQYYATSPGKARAQAFANYQSAYDAATFKEFLKISRVRLCGLPHPVFDGYAWLRSQYPDCCIPPPGTRVRAEGHVGIVLAALKPTSYVQFHAEATGRQVNVHPSSVELA